MKLIYLSNSRLPTERAHGIQIMKMCEAFAAAGLKVELIVPWRFNKIKENPFDYYGVKKSFRIKKLPSLDLMLLGLPKIGFWIQNWSFAKLVFFCLLFAKAEIIYSRDILPLFFLSYFKKNLIYEAHTFPKRFSLYKGLFRRIKAIVVITKELKNLFVKNGITPDKILVAPDGVDLEEFNIKEFQEECRRKLNLPLDKKIIGYVGQLKTMGMEKGIGCLIKALGLLKKDNPSITLCLVGGRESDIVEYKKMANGLNAIFVRQVQHKLIPYYLRSFDVLAMLFPWTKHFAYYMSPLKMFEYMTAQRPIVASDLPSIREVLNKNSAVLVKPNNSQSLARGN